MLIGLILLAVSMLSAASYHVVVRQDRDPPLAPPQAPSRAAYDKQIAGTGLIEAQTENISLGSALSGVVLEVYYPSTRVGEQVKAGTPLFRVDDRNLKAQLQSAEATVVASEAQLRKLEALPRPEDVPPSEANVRALEANVAHFLDDYQRAEGLFKSKTITESELVTKRTAYENAFYLATQAKAQHQLLIAGAWEPDKAIARAAITQSKSAVEQIRTEIERAIVRAPIDCKLLQVNVRPGQQVTANDTSPLMVLGDTGELHVRADVDENDIPRFDLHRTAVAVERGSKHRTVALEFRRIEPMVEPKKQLTGANTERIDTRVLQVIYAVKPTDVPLFVGQQVDVYVEADRPQSPDAAGLADGSDAGTR
jgi:multidrug resistance efflux pump